MNASDLLSWLLSKNYENFDLHLSPDVEDNLKLGIGIDVERVGKKNLRQLFDLLSQEITEKTEFEAKDVPWAEGFYDPTIRIFFRKKLTLRSRLSELFNHSFARGESTEVRPAFEMR
jgi:hypothetical protein